MSRADWLDFVLRLTTKFDTRYVIGAFAARAWQELAARQFTPCLASPVDRPKARRAGKHSVVC